MNQKFISIQSDIEAISKDYFSLSRNLKEQYLKYSINQVGRKARTETIRTISKTLSIPQNVIRGTKSGVPMFKEKPATNKDMTYSMKVNSKFLHVSEKYFAPSQKKAGVSAKYYGKRRTFDGGFFGYGKTRKANGDIENTKYIAWKRVKDSFYEIRGKRKMIKRQKIKPLFAFNPATEFMKNRIAGYIVDKYSPLIPETFQRKLDQYLNRRHRTKSLV